MWAAAAVQTLLRAVVTLLRVCLAVCDELLHTVGKRLGAQR